VPIAFEGALKLKEISYIHAEGYAAGELKHGPIALIEDGTPVIVLAPMDELYEKTVSNLQEVASRGARVTLITDAAGAATGNSMADEFDIHLNRGSIRPRVYPCKSGKFYPTKSQKTRNLNLSRAL